MNIIEEIAAHEKEIFSGTIPNGLQLCPKCNESHVNIKLHDCKERVFLVVEKDMVRRVESFLGRWKCLFCRKTFINYPSFALPYKRYTIKDVLGFSQSYGENHEMTYEKVVREEQLAIGYTEQDGIKEGRQLAASTVWRWISFLGILSQTSVNYIQLILQKNPASNIARRLYPVTPRKHKSQDRKKNLQQSLRLIDAESEYRKLFGISFFPQLAIRSFMS